MNKKPIIAFLYDFDKTLCTTDMQDYTFIPSLGYTPGEFWSIANSFGFENRMDGLLAYMYTMIEECRKKGIRLSRDYLVSCGHAIELFPGVEDWFARINAFGESLGVEIEHYVLSSGLREIINALRYLIRSGCSWRMLPQEFGPWQTVYWWFRRLMRRFLFATILDICTMLDRHRQKKTLAPSLAVLDSQSVKAPHASDRGIDAHKKIVGRKRHVAVDSDGRLLLVNMTPANVADSTGAQMILDAMYRKWPSVKHFFADGAYERKSLMDKAAYLGFVVEVVKRTPGQTGFQPVAKRWVVERTFGWLVRWRRLVRDYERRLDVSESMIQIAMASILLKRFIIDK